MFAALDSDNDDEAPAPKVAAKKTEVKAAAPKADAPKASTAKPKGTSSYARVCWRWWLLARYPMKWLAAGDLIGYQRFSSLKLN